MRSTFLIAVLTLMAWLPAQERGRLQRERPAPAEHGRVMELWRSGGEGPRAALRERLRERLLGLRERLESLRAMPAKPGKAHAERRGGEQGDGRRPERRGESRPGSRGGTPKAERQRERPKASGQQWRGVRRPAASPLESRPWLRRGSLLGRRDRG